MITNKNKSVLQIILLLVTGLNLGLNATFILLSSTNNISKNSYELENSRIETSNHGYMDYNNQELFWFIHITDTQFTWFDDNKTADFYQFLNESYKEINPLFIYNTGDLVDADNGVKQNIEEWKQYKKALEDNNMNSSIYIDLVGNHDAVKDTNYFHYLNYSMIGKNFNVLQYSFNKSFSFGNYAFIGLNTAKSSYKFYEFALFGFLNTTELDWYEKELEKYKQYDRIFLFGHNPYNCPSSFTIISNLSSSGKSFLDLNKEYNVFCYLSGHIHMNSFHKENGFLMITTSNFDQNGGTYRIVSIDNNYFSTVLENVGKWPQGIITYPPSKEYLIRKKRFNINHIRVLAWDPNGIKSVKWALYDIKGETRLTKWVSLKNNPKNKPLWEGDWDFKLDGKFLIKVKIEGNSGEIIREIVYYLQNDWIITFLLIFVISILALISITVIIIVNSKVHIFRLKEKERGT